MKLTCALLVTVASFAAGSPHGYGVKGGAGSGAVAGAQATAVAGAGAIGLGEAAPFGSAGGFSGSFSKSSASSFAASSASSGSFSYNGGYNGAGALGGGNGGSNIGSEGGALKSEGGSGYGGLSGAQAGAAAGAFAIAPTLDNGSPCTGNCAGIAPAGCQGHSCSVSNGDKCTSGQCLPNPDKPSQYDSDDIPVNFASKPKKSFEDNGITPQGEQSPKGPCGSGNCGSPAFTNPNPSSSSYQPSYPQKPSNCYSGNCGSPSGSYPHTQNTNNYDSISKGNQPCASGNCGSPALTNLKPSGGSNEPSYPQSPSGLYEPSYPTPSYSTGDKSPYPEPSRLLTTPKEKFPEAPKCSSPNCGSDSYSPKLPSSYNVPFNGAYPSQGNSPYSPSIDNGASTNSPNSYKPGFPHKNSHDKPCNTPVCAGSAPTGPSYPVKIPSFNGPQSGKPSSGCANGVCGMPQREPIPHGFAPSVQPSYLHSPSPQYQSPNIPSESGCPSGNCGNSPTFQPGPPKQGCSSGNCDTRPSFQTGPLKPSQVPAGSPPYCAGGNCGGSPPHPNPSDPDPNSFVALIPNAAVSPTKLPAYHGSFGGPSGILKPNDYSLPGKPSIVPHPSNSPSPSYDTPVGAPSIPQQPAGGNSPQANPQPTHSAPHYNGAGSQSSASAVAGASASAYTGSFGGPPGFLKPFDGGKGSGPSSNDGKYGAAPNSVTGGDSSLGSGQYGSGASSGAFSGAGAYSGGFGQQGGQQYQGQGGKDYNGSGHGGAECNGGCGGHAGGGHGGGLGVSGSFGSSFGLGLAKGGLDALAGGINVAVSAAKSISGAVSGAHAGSGAGSFGLSGSFASSAATSGAATKGGYGK